MLSALLGFFLGSGQALQTLINSRLRQFLGSPFYASFISFSVGSLTLALLVLLSGQPLWIESVHWQNLPFWAWLGGALGVVALTSNILLFPHLGSMQTALMPILGQVFMGVIIDHFGFFHAPQHGFSALRLAGLVLVLFGVFAAVVLPQRGTEAVRAEQGLWGWRVLGIVAGALGATQTAINGTLGRELDSALMAALVSFVVGALCLLAILLVKRESWRALPQAIKQGMPKWCLTGGALGALFVSGAVLLVHWVGTGLTVMVMLLGLIGGSLIIDQLGILGTPKKRILPVQLAGLALLLGGIALVRLG